MLHKLTARPPFQRAVYTHNEVDLKSVNREFENQNIQARIDWASRRFGEDLALISSFGVQSIISIFAVRQAAPDVPIIHVDIAGDKFEAARRYRDFLAGVLKFEPLVVYAKHEEDKARVTQEALTQLGFSGFIRGIRAAQTRERQERKFVEIWGDGFTQVAPILDWTDKRIDAQMQKLPSGLLHPEYQPGAQSKGGAVLGQDEVKTECLLDMHYGANI